MDKNNHMDTFKQLKIIFFALAAGQVFYFVVSFILIENGTVMLNKDFSTMGGFIVPLVVVLMVVASKLLYNRAINSKVKAGDEEKLITYRTSNILKFALLEGANMFSITFYLLTGDFLYAGMFVIILGIFFVNYPGREKFMAEFGLSSFRE